MFRVWVCVCVCFFFEGGGGGACGVSRIWGVRFRVFMGFRTLGP